MRPESVTGVYHALREQPTILAQPTPSASRVCTSSLASGFILAALLPWPALVALRMWFRELLDKHMQRLRLASTRRHFSPTEDHHLLLPDHHAARPRLRPLPPAYRVLIRSLNSIFTFLFSWLPGIATACAGMSFESSCSSWPRRVVSSAVGVARLEGERPQTSRPTFCTFVPLYPFVHLAAFGR